MMIGQFGHRKDFGWLDDPNTDKALYDQMIRTQIRLWMTRRTKYLEDFGYGL